MNILFVTQRLSDFVEMKRASVGLKNYNYRRVVLFCGVGQKQYDNEVIAEINKSISNGDFDDEILKATYIPQTIAHQVYTRVQRFTQLSNKITGFIAPKTTPRKVIPDTSHKTPALEEHVSAETRMQRVMLWLIENILKAIKRLSVLHLTLVPVSYYIHFKTFKKLLRLYDIKLIVLPEDIVGYVSPVLIRAGHACKIPSMIIPYTICNQTEAFQSLKNNPSFGMQIISNKLAGAIFKNWVMQDATHKVLRLPAPHIIGHVVTRSSPPDPWMMNSGFANVIAIENDRMYKYYKDAGIPTTKMKVTGACYDDYLAYYLADKENQRQIVYAELGITSTKPILLIGGFPNQLIGNPPGFDFESIENAVEFLVAELQPLCATYELVFRPHPNYQELSALFAAKQVVTTTIDTARLIPLSDIYVAFASATIRWAIACGIPSINYDIFHYDFADYKDVHGVLHALTQDDFKNAVHTLCDSWHLQRLKNYLAVEKTSWGSLDGQSCARINQLVTELLQLRRIRRTAA